MLYTQATDKSRTSFWILTNFVKCYANLEDDILKKRPYVFWFEICYKIFNLHRKQVESILLHLHAHKNFEHK